MRGEAAVVFPHQLFARHPAIARGRLIVLLSDSPWFCDPLASSRVHQQKLAFHRITLDRWTTERRREGFCVEVVRSAAHTTWVDGVESLASRGILTWWIAQPTDDRLERQIRHAAERTGARVQWLDTPAFLVSKDWNSAWLETHPSARLTDYYIAQRRDRHVLLEGGDRPVGGRWSFDAENRRPWPRDRVPPPVPRAQFAPDDRALAIDVAAQFPSHPGQATDLWLPTDHDGAQRWLDEFVRERLAGFGPYQDAMLVEHDVLCHSVLSPLLNVGLLLPQDVLDAVIGAWREGWAPIQSVEGFVRQVLGWREYVRALYEHRGAAMRTSNFWGHHRPLPAAFYSANTGLLPLDCALRRVLRLGWCHHIERLMVIGAAMFMLELDPNVVYQWFMDMFLDAHDWVMVPNVYGMSQFADGGRMATKPYLSASAYLRRMGDFPPGPWCEVWDGLFWRFVGRHREYIARHPRLAMLAHQYDHMDMERRRQIFDALEHWESDLT